MPEINQMRMAAKLEMLLFFAWRNLWRNPRRTLLSMLGIMISLAILILIQAFSLGAVKQMESNAIQYLTGHLQIRTQAYQQDPVIEHGFQRDQMLEQAGSIEAPVRIARIRVPVTLQSAKRSLSTQLVSIRWDKDIKQSFLSRAQLERIPQPGSQEILLGAAMAKRLALKPGQRVVVSAQDAQGKGVSRGFRLAGVYHTALKNKELQFQFISEQALETFLAAPGMATEVQLTFKKQSQVNRFIQSHPNLCQQFACLSWQEQHPFVASWTETMDSIMYFYLCVVILSIAISLINNILLSLLERTREVGLLQVIGMSSRLTLAQLAIESSYILLIGILGGLLLAIFGLSLLSQGIDLSHFANGIEVIDLNSVVYPAWSVDLLIYNSLLIGVVGFVTGLLPLLQATKLLPQVALNRY